MWKDVFTGREKAVLAALVALAVLLAAASQILQRVLIAPPGGSSGMLFSAEAPNATPLADAAIF